MSAADDRKVGIGQNIKASVRGSRTQGSCVKGLRTIAPKGEEEPELATSPFVVPPPTRPRLRMLSTMTTLRTRRAAATTLVVVGVLAATGCTVETDAPAAPASPAAATKAPAPVAVDDLTTHAATVADEVLHYRAVRGSYPYLADLATSDLPEGAMVTQYAATPRLFRFCVVSEADGAWVAFESDRGGVTGSGARGQCTFAE